VADSAKREQWKEFLDEFQTESDRSCAVLGAAFLDEQLRSLLEAFIVDDPKRIAELFDGVGAPLSSFSAKIQMAYALGFVSPSELRDLELIRKVRNEFAHDLHGVIFATPSVASRCAELTGCNVVAGSIGGLGPRSRFTVSVAMLANWVALRRLGIRDARRQVQGEVKVGWPIATEPEAPAQGTPAAN